MHFYNQLGNPVYEVDRADKKGKRDTTIRDARKLKLQPSVTTITGMLDKPGLLNYFLTQTINTVLNEKGKTTEETQEEYIKRIIFLSQQESKKARDEGSKLHDALETYYKTGNKGEFGGLENKGTREFIEPVIDEISRISNTTKWNPESSFSHSLGFGGKVDLHAQDIIIDFKTKATDDKKKFYKYDEHLMQLSAYRLGLRMPEARCLDVYFSSTKPNIIEVHEWSPVELIRGEKMFLSLLEYWKVCNEYDSSFKIEQIPC